MNKRKFLSFWRCRAFWLPWPWRPGDPNFLFEQVRQSFGNPLLASDWDVFASEFLADGFHSFGKGRAAALFSTDFASYSAYVALGWFG